MSFLNFFKKKYEVYNIYDFTDKVLLAELKAYEKGFSIFKNKYNYIKNNIFLNDEEGLKNWEDIFLILKDSSFEKRKENIFSLTSLNNLSFTKKDMLKALKSFKIELDIVENENGEIVLSNILKDGKYINLDDKNIYKYLQKFFPVNTIIKYDNGIFSFKYINSLDYTFIDFDNSNKSWSYLVRE